RAADLPSGESPRSYLDRAELLAEDRELAEMFIEGFYAAPLDDISIASVAGDAGGASASEQKRPSGGYGAFVRWLSAWLAVHRVVVHTNFVVDEIEWSHEGITLASTEHTATARWAIVTVPIGALPA